MVNQHKLGMLFGVFIGLLHIEWVSFMATGVAKPVIDWILRVHFIQISYTLMPITVGSAITLFVLAFVFGYVSGWIIGFIWNALHGEFPAIAWILSAGMNKR